MGEVAEDMADGTCCTYCGQYFKHPRKKDHLWTHGFPVVCKECWEELDTKGKRDAARVGLQKATENTL
jgi:hypothetical protein